jgi:NAD(P)-dependent dehydrogenase (short-subunit alcohol dehydrogenase family)
LAAPRLIKADVRQEEDVRALVDKTVARFGRLDVAVNNAGAEGDRGLVIDQTAENKAASATGVPMGRLGLAEELAAAIVFIGSTQASFITGHVLNVDGGKTN